ncbi:DEAD/DEAH box helicase [Mucilaginibacter aquatilis]|uniref:ATP-dependent helicase n=1 Tax=Mucilaginibacter aquatilis TaxID=1517760 RepID=A0A6I4I7R1_9SPHI|nr:DEAD/DEAH box helicase [Mucilaginibacter aquatilis]MVN91220.1 ATP-dependent helicase [Mucilaginibacter aquatilis]
MTNAGFNNEELPSSHTYVLNKSIGDLTDTVIAQHSTGGQYATVQPLQVDFLTVNRGIFSAMFNAALFPVVEVVKLDDGLHITCHCNQTGNRLCEHQASVVQYITHTNDLRLFFDDDLRNQHLKQKAIEFGLQNEPDLSLYFELIYKDGAAFVKPLQHGLYPVNLNSLSHMKQLLLPKQEVPLAHQNDNFQQRFIVFKQHKYYKHLMIDLCDAPLTKDAKIKNPVEAVNPLEQVWSTDDPLELKFFTALMRFQSAVNAKVDNATIQSLKAVVRNPLSLPCYLHNSEISEKLTANALMPVKVSRVKHNINIKVYIEGDFYRVSATLQLGSVVYALNELHITHDYFIQVPQNLYLVKDVQMLNIIAFFGRIEADLLIHHSRYNQLRSHVLSNLEESVNVSYTYLKPATQDQIAEQGFDKNPEMTIYLSDFGQHVMIFPVMLYGETEVPIRTKKEIHAQDSKGKYFQVKRNHDAEAHFMSLILRQHINFEEQLTDELQYFYLHKKYFLNADWLLNTFEKWTHSNINILGFSELSNNKLNANKVKVTVQVISGINWFNTIITAQYGKQRASLKHLHKAIRNKSKFVQLDDGTLGILPEEWMQKFAVWFNVGEVLEDVLLTPKTGFASIEQMYDASMLEANVIQEIRNYKSKFQEFKSIKQASIPVGLNATLRGYQQEGLNWLNFLDEFNFGGCLADDMGLGKTLQIIAFILLQRQKVANNVNLVVVPTSLVFNWQTEVSRFAPNLKLHTLYGANRRRSTAGFDEFDIILTTYGTLLSDVNYLKEFEFNYVILDESQNIKNPESQRYKAARLLKARNRIAVTGTPIENNTFDLYAQLSFACPGLLGSKQYFKEIYSTPIDQFKEGRRSVELQEKIKPFVLRRTKQEVAHELPEKTEMVVYCEMQTQQRKFYEAYEREFREYISAVTQEELPKNSMHVLRGLTRLRQICNSPLLISGDKLPGNESAKIEVLLEQIQSKASNHKILVFSQFVTMLNLIGKELDWCNIGYTKLTGSTKNRQAVVDEFQNNNDVRVFLVSLKAGGTGLNLTAADYVYLVDPWWNPAVENQAIDRAYRIGQQKHVVAVRLICTDTIEEKIAVLQETKLNLSEHLIGQDDGFFKSLNRDDLLGLLNHP